VLACQADRSRPLRGWVSVALCSTGQKNSLRNPQLLKLSSRVRRTFPRSSRPLLVGVSCIDPHALHGRFAFELPPPTFVCPHQFDELVPVALISCLFILPDDLFRVGHLAEPGLPYTPLVPDFVPARHAFSYHESRWKNGSPFSTKGAPPIPASLTFLLLSRRLLQFAAREHNLTNF